MPAARSPGGSSRSRTDSSTTAPPSPTPSTGSGRWRCSQPVEPAGPRMAVAAHTVQRGRARRTPILLGRELVVLAAARQRSGRNIAAELHEAAAIARRTGARIIVDDARLFVSHSPTDLSGLTAREREVMDRVPPARPDDLIARTLGISTATVRAPPSTHLRQAQRLDPHRSRRTGHRRGGRQPPGLISAISLIADLVQSCRSRTIGAGSRSVDVRYRSCRRRARRSSRTRRL